MRLPTALIFLCFAALTACTSPSVMPESSDPSAQPMTPPAAAPAEPEGPIMVPQGEIPNLANLTRMMRHRFWSERAYCATVPLGRDCDVVAFWNMLVADLRFMNRLDQVIQVNRYFNETFEYQHDEKTFGIGDYHATPFVFMVKGRGDCEEFAYAKYLALIEAGFPKQDIRIFLVRERGDDHEYHLLPIVRINGKSLGLDLSHSQSSQPLPAQIVLNMYEPISVYGGGLYIPYGALAWTSSKDFLL